MLSDVETPPFQPGPRVAANPCGSGDFGRFLTLAAVSDRFHTAIPKATTMNHHESKPPALPCPMTVARHGIARARAWGLVACSGGVHGG
jgi:hypothetical protein